MHRLTVLTSEHQQLVDISDRVQAAVRHWRDGAVVAYVPHTTAGILINANAEPEVAHDILRALDMIVPVNADFRHNTGNSPSHVKTVLVGTSQVIPVVGGKLQLGTWQSIFLAEFDGPRTRSVLIASLEVQ